MILLHCGDGMGPPLPREKNTLFEFNPREHEPENCVECGEAVPMDIEPTKVVIGLEGETYAVEGLYRCISCQAFIEAGAISSSVDLKAAHEWLTYSALPNALASMWLLQGQLMQATPRGGRKPGPQAIALSVFAMKFLEVTGPSLDQAARLADLLDEHFGVDSSAGVEARMWEAIREAQPKRSEQELDEYITRLDLRREPDGTVTYACSNEDCPEGNSRHPLGFAEHVMPTELVEAIIKRMPD